MINQPICPVCITPLVPLKKEKRLGKMPIHKKWLKCPDCGYIDSKDDISKANLVSLDSLKERKEKAANSIDRKYFDEE